MRDEIKHGPECERGGPVKQMERSLSIIDGHIGDKRGEQIVQFGTGARRATVRPHGTMPHARYSGKQSKG